MSVNLAVNYVAVIVAAIVATIVGFIWSRPRVFGTLWMGYLGIRPTELQNPGPGRIAIGVIAALVKAWVLALFAVNLGGRSVSDGVMLGVLTWLGFMATITAVQVGFERKPWGYWLLNNGHHIIVQALMGAIVTAWR